MRFGLGSGSRRLLAHPGSWLAALLIAAFAFLAGSGGLVPRRHADSYSYVEATHAANLEQALAYHRTVGYPLFLASVKTGRGGFERRYAPVVAVQNVLYLMAVFAFWLGARSYLRSGWTAFAAAAPLPFAGIVDTGDLVGPDLLSAACVLAACGLALRIAAHPGRIRLALPLLAVAVFCAYQMRPAAMNLIAFLPVAVATTAAAAGTATGRRLVRPAAGVAVATLLPFLLFASVRWAVVGHFGLVSFGGANQAALAACFLDRDLAAELPREVRPLARRFVDLRAERGWRAIGPHDDPADWFEQYGDNIWRIGRPAARALVRRERRHGAGDGERPLGVEADARLGALAREILWRRPAGYLAWIGAALRYGARQLAASPWIVGSWALLTLSLPFAAWRVELGPPRPPAPGAASAAERRRRLSGLALFGVGYFAAYLLLVCLVSFPFERYLHSTTLLLPGVAVALTFEIWRSALAPTAD